MRKNNKSSFKDAIKLFPCVHSMFKDVCPYVNMCEPVAIYVDFLYFLHMPPPVNVATYNEFSEYLWRKIVGNYTSKYNIKEFYIIIDKPNYLPPPRSIVHKSRYGKNKSIPLSIPDISDNGNMYHSAEYTTFLGDQEYKNKIICYLSNKFIQFALLSTSHLPALRIVIDSPAFDHVKCLEHGQQSDLVSNEHGEADYAIWYHVIRSPVNNIVVLSKDTDTWVYGLALIELGLIHEKNVVIHQGLSSSFAYLNEGVKAINSLEQLKQIKYPVTCFVAIYILSGCDYVSSFYRLICFWNVLLTMLIIYVEMRSPLLI